WLLRIRLASLRSCAPITLQWTFFEIMSCTISTSNGSSSTIRTDAHDSCTFFFLFTGAIFLPLPLSIFDFGFLMLDLKFQIENQNSKIKTLIAPPCAAPPLVPPQAMPPAAASSPAFLHRDDFLIGSSRRCVRPSEAHWPIPSRGAGRLFSS